MRWFLSFLFLGFWGAVHALSLGPSLTPKLLLDFLKKEGNILLGLSGKAATPTAINSLLQELEIYLPLGRSSVVVDHFNYDTLSAAEKHDVLLLPRPTSLRQGVKSFFSGDGILAIPRAVGQSLGIASPLIAPILRAPETAYPSSSKDDDIFATGTQLALISALQARNSARFTVLGSVEALEDKWFSAHVKGPKDQKQLPTVNREFAKQLSAWAFKETGVLRVGEIKHHLSDKDGAIVGDMNPKIYRIKNDIAFHIELSEHGFDGWVPFDVPSDDALQLDFTMLSPFYRLNLTPKASTKNSTIFGTSFTLPDQHGIFSFRINYRRPFLSNIEEKHEVTLRHFAHNEYPRSWEITGAWVWVTGLWSVIAGFLALVIIWLYSAPSSTAGVRTKKIQ
ncbi:hypothetical protein Egran_01851 [Elaphomyces granulatus]|uniref:Dolichyl-diphosphooligosaccharide--protein glycosyltransferase subunit WBP1 n=1 Tax=Elaphomyces granulatus TaxID=519963 RepID=A0A232M1Y6_9EURO|nr:hypothetical protein Egran_01851 [Elaphomyces granulatus]